eukprot:CAMPEP_0201923208 /NCGR_PEP_ID=MMETSP0903-20130614/11017_1 /ASSEMBLY_ACC=CAM_ASM_000552 /TAXON_ID=420261 /ORGANISM="Thalassiosira antarctica, Strain CCMP982" /LENGTH=484 /DNA_ID=CAMNT_0048460485 /DNA_START=227 /DNA_END=1681 /DNA_ORIENTATION=+
MHQRQPSMGYLNCSVHGGPSNELAAEMVYWSDIPADRTFTSPFYSNDTATTKYLTFEPDFGGFNNIRMSFETMILLSHSMGRTLVLPPPSSIYWSNKLFSFEEFYDLENISSEHAGLDIITMEHYLKLTEIMLTSKDSHPSDNNRSVGRSDMQSLKELAYTPENWRPGECVVTFPNATGSDNLDVMQYYLKSAIKECMYNRNTVIPVDASTTERLRVAILEGYGAALCLYDEIAREQLVIHFPCCKREQRMLTHHYTFLFFQDWRHDLWSKRFVRDNLRFRDEIQCAAARVVVALRQRARLRDNNNSNGDFDSFHIRRGDLVKQYKTTGVSADEIYQNSRGELRVNATVFIATDEVNRTFFEPLTSKYDVVFLEDDFQQELVGIDKMYFGLIDQLIASRGRVFFGCKQSTFSNFIFRLRAWHSQRDKLKGSENDGMIDNSYYYTSLHHKYDYQQYPPMPSHLWMREWPAGWRDMDMGIDETSTA